MKYETLVKFIVASALIFPVAASAENLNLKSPKTGYSVGDSFTVSLTLDTKGQSVNTVSGKIQLPTSHLQILDVRYGSSIIALWVERPVVSGGAISFTGGTPGGFSGSAGPILSFGVKARAEGSATINLKDIKILLNDGKGTELAATSGTLKLTINKALPKSAPEKQPKEEYIPPPDTVPPESFIPLISRHSSVADNKYFVSFFAVDKDSGVASYEVREEPVFFSRLTSRFNIDFVKTESPYVLHGQYWAYKVAVRACDQAGNCTDAFVQKTLHPMVVVAIILALLFLSVLWTRWIYKPRRTPRKMV